MTRDRFIKKWLANPEARYDNENRDAMRDDLDMVIDKANQNHGVIGDVIETFESKMKAIDNKVIFGDYITYEEKDFYNENLDRMVENCNDESIRWKHHASKI